MIYCIDSTPALASLSATLLALRQMCEGVRVREGLRRAWKLWRGPRRRQLGVIFPGYLPFNIFFPSLLWFWSLLQWSNKWGFDLEPFSLLWWDPKFVLSYWCRIWDFLQRGFMFGPSCFLWPLHSLSVLDCLLMRHQSWHYRSLAGGGAT